MSFLPVLIPCPEPKSDGTTSGKHVQVVSFELVDLLIANRSAFHEKYRQIGETEEKWLRGCWLLDDAVRGGKKQKLAAVAEGLGVLAERELEDSILADPVTFVQKQLNELTAGVCPVLWRPRTKSVLNAGIFCKGGMLNALATLMLFRIDVGDSGGTGFCDICGASFPRERADRRKTCSDKCRKRASRLKPHTTAAKPS